MAQISDEEAKKILSVILISQSLIHAIDELEDTVFFKQEFKQKANQYLNYINARVDPICRNVNSEEVEYYNAITNMIDKVAIQEVKRITDELILEFRI